MRGRDVITSRNAKRNAQHSSILMQRAGAHCPDMRCFCQALFCGSTIVVSGNTVSNTAVGSHNIVMGNDSGASFYLCLFEQNLPSVPRTP